MKKVVVHIGAGPALPGQLGPPVKPGEVHVVFEPEPDEDLYKTRARELRKMGVRLFLRRSTGAATKFKDGSVDMVHIHDVLNDPQIHSLHRSGFLPEASRILKKGGEIYVGNTNTPSVLPLDELKDSARQLGLTLQVLAINKHRDARQWTLQERQVIREKMGGQACFIVLFRARFWPG